MCSSTNHTNITVNEPYESRPDARDICLIIISILGISLNGFLLCILRLPKTCSVFVRNLAIVDLFIAVVSIFWVFRHKISSKPEVSIVLITLSWIFVFISFLIIFAIALQRYIAVSFALWTYSKMESMIKCMKVLSISTWLISIIFCSARIYLDWKIISLILTILFEVLLLTTVSLYVMIFVSFRRYRLNGCQGVTSNGNISQVHLEKENKLTKTVFWVSSILMIGVIPYIIFLQLTIIGQLFHRLHGLTCSVMFDRLFHYWILLEMLAFSLNPVIYFSRHHVNYQRLKRIRERLECLPQRNFRISINEVHIERTNKRGGDKYTVTTREL